MRDRGATETIRRLAEAQHGVVSRAQLLDAGLGRQLIAARLEAGLLLAVHEGVFAVGHGHIPREGRWLGAVLASGREAVLSHGSAAELWGVGEMAARVEVTRRSGGTSRSAIWVHQTRSLPADHITVRLAIPTTSLERTVLDMASRTGRRGLERMIVDADRAGSLNWRRLWEVIECGVGRKGLRTLRLVAAEIDPRSRDTRSPLEVDFLARCRDAGLPRPQVNVLVEGHLVDFVWREQRLVVETDGYAFHSDRRAFERDRERDLDLTAAGYRVNRFTYKMLNRSPDDCMERIRQAIFSASSLSPAGSEI